MIWSIFKWLLTLLVVYLIVRELRMYASIHRISNKFTDVIYIPLIGVAYYYFAGPIEDREVDKIKWLKKRVNIDDIKGKKAIVMNTPFFPNPITLLIDPMTIADFYAKEKEYLERVDFQKEPKLMHFGFFYQNNAHAYKMRGAFTDVFKAENLLKISGKIEFIIVNKIQQIVMENEEQFRLKVYADIDMKEVRPI